ncbi:unnamed protein product [Orchesella dallaii]|uniref:DNA-directed RNA polymerase n=1 Tax=Orchesella dallaii TaxID=48710 RepID=A0ABP1QF92_9HEXA
MMSHIFRTDLKVLKSLIRLHHRGSGIVTPQNACENSCPNCGYARRSISLVNQSQYATNEYGLLRYTTRPFSTKTSSNPLLSSLKKSAKKRKGKKSSKTTEIIEEHEKAKVKESTAQLLTLKNKDLSSYIGKLISEASNSKGLSSYTVGTGTMSYSTSSDSPFTVFNYSSPIEPQGHFDLEFSGNSYSSFTDIEMEKSFNVDEGMEQDIVIRKSNSCKTRIPLEKDLIDEEVDTDSIDVASRIRKLDLEKSIHAESDASIPSNLSNDSPISSQSRQSVTPKKKVSLKKENKRSYKYDEREMLAKVKREQMEKLASEVSLNKSLVAYLDMCVFTGQLNRGLNSLNHYRERGRNSSVHSPVTDVKAFNIILHGFAAKGNFKKVKEVFSNIKNDGLKPSVQSYAAVFECIARMAPNVQNKEIVCTYVDALIEDGYEINDLFNKTVFAGDQQRMVLRAIKLQNRDFSPKIQKPFTGYTCKLLQEINSAKSSFVSPAEGLISIEHLKNMADQQLKMELEGTVTIKSIERKDGLENLPYYRKLLQETEERWAEAIKEAIERNFRTLLHQGMKQKYCRTIGLYPFLKVLQPDDYVELIKQEIRKLAEGSETYSPSVTQLYREFGSKVLSRYQVIYKKEKGILEKVHRLYHEYINWYINTTNSNQKASETKNARHKWQDLIYDPKCTGPHVDIGELAWPNSVLSSIGRVLYGIVMRDIKINSQAMKLNSKTEHLVPAFYSIFRMQGVHLKEEIKPHPALVKLFQAASRDELTFDATLVPMVSPPLPWASIRTGGYLLTPAKIIRLPYQAHQQRTRLENCSPDQLYPALDSLNQLGGIPWKINHKVLDTVVEVFNNKGDDDLGIPSPPSECPLPPSIELNMTRQEKLKVHKTRLALKRKKAEMYSLWCDALYRLSLANHFRDDIFWFPHNMDFRGRVYPCPPHLNHLGADMARSILVFAQGKPLGPVGLDWLKTHLVNLTGLKKRDSVDDRLKYANEILDDILDSADNPLTGRKWWAESEEPWQTLACCIEIANAIRSGDPEAYVSHFPVHQDGSCNGLQHYAALGRDQAGAESVNLAPSLLPQDVYSSVATLVEKLRQEDAEKGVKIAQVLDGFIKRKVIKQTVMTTVYGVTRYGARLQIAKQLKDIPGFPKEHMWPASLYLVGRTFDSLQEMFTSTKEIQDWFTECARLISQICGQNVEWITPLGLPVVQPYFRQNKKPYEGFDPSKLPESHALDSFERPNVMKQKNAFPPNFIHSLDSSHMMLTSLHCEQAGITFASVHDCYWTHPCTVEIMNRICREQFVALHSEPILEDLSKFLVEKYSYRENELFKDGSVVDSAKRRLNELLTEVPNKGAFDLKSVLKSIYFFS